MSVSPQEDLFLHEKLPIDNDERIIAVYRHHGFAYFVNIIFAVAAIAAMFGLVLMLKASGGSNGPLAHNFGIIFAFISIVSLLIIAGAIVIIHLKLQEQLVLTSESLLQVLKPTIFTAKIDQINLERIDNVHVYQDFFGTVIGYGHLTVETPGEQDNFEFNIVSHPKEIVKEITNVCEDYKAALQTGQVTPNPDGQYIKHKQDYSAPDTTPINTGQPQQSINVNSNEYQQFLEYQRTKNSNQSYNSAPTSGVTEHSVPDGLDQYGGENTGNQAERPINNN